VADQVKGHLNICLSVVNIDKTKAPADLGNTRAATLAILADRYKCNASKAIDESRDIMPQVKHDGKAIGSSLTNIKIPTDGRVVYVLYEKDFSIDIPNKAIANFYLLAAPPDKIRLRAATLRMPPAPEIFEKVDLQYSTKCLSKEPTYIFNLLSGPNCIPVQRLVKIEAVLEFSPADAGKVVQLYYEIVKETSDGVAKKGESVMRECIYEQQQAIKGEADGSDWPYYKFNIPFDNPVKEIRAFLPVAAIDAWLLLDYESHGLHLKRGDEPPVDDHQEWVISFEGAEIGFGRILFPKIVYRVHHEQKSPPRDVAVYAQSLNIMRYKDDRAGMAYVVDAYNH
jgi:hypothetical protein